MRYQHQHNQDHKHKTTSIDGTTAAFLQWAL